MNFNESRGKKNGSPLGINILLEREVNIRKWLISLFDEMKKASNLLHVDKEDKKKNQQSPGGNTGIMAGCAKTGDVVDRHPERGSQKLGGLWTDTGVPLQGKTDSCSIEAKGLRGRKKQGRM